MHALRMLWAAHNEEMWLRRHERRISRKCLEQISEIPDELFHERYRLDKQTFRKLCQDLRDRSLLRGTKEIPLEIKVLCTLSFLATGSYQRTVGLTQHLTQRTASRCIRQVVQALNSDYMLRNIEFPETLQERSEITQEFQTRFNLPGVIGCIDCTHIAIVKPDKEEHLYYNRKGYHSLNVQMICDHNLNILYVNTKHGGATDDSVIWGSSQVEPFMRELHQSGEQTWLLGDSEYPLKPWLLTPILNAVPGSREEIYNTRHAQARKCIERCFDVLKGRWRCLSNRSLHYHPHVASDIVSACCVLHNIAIQAQVPLPIDVSEQHDEESVVSTPSSEEDLMRGREMLNILINSL